MAIVVYRIQIWHEQNIYDTWFFMPYFKIWKNDRHLVYYHYPTLRRRPNHVKKQRLCYKTDTIMKHFCQQTVCYLVAVLANSITQFSKLMRKKTKKRLPSVRKLQLCIKSAWKNWKIFNCRQYFQVN